MLRRMFLLSLLLLLAAIFGGLSPKPVTSSSPKPAAWFTNISFSKSYQLIACAGTKRRTLRQRT